MDKPQSEKFSVFQDGTLLERIPDELRVLITIQSILEKPEDTPFISTAAIVPLFEKPIEIFALAVAAIYKADITEDERSEILMEVVLNNKEYLPILWKFTSTKNVPEELFSKVKKTVNLLVKLSLKDQKLECYRSFISEIKKYLSGIDLSGDSDTFIWVDDNHPDIMVDMEYANLAGANLTGCNFIRFNFSNANFLGTDLTGCLFSFVKLVDTNLTGATLSNMKAIKTDFSKVIVNDSLFEQPNLPFAFTMIGEIKNLKKLAEESEHIGSLHYVWKKTLALWTKMRSSGNICRVDSSFTTFDIPSETPSIMGILSTLIKKISEVINSMNNALNPKQKEDLLHLNRVTINLREYLGEKNLGALIEKNQKLPPQLPARKRATAQHPPSNKTSETISNNPSRFLNSSPSETGKDNGKCASPNKESPYSGTF